MIDSTCTYTALRISVEKNRFAYVKAVSRCLNLCAGKGNDLNRMRQELQRVRRQAPRSFIPRLQVLGSVKGYYIMGIVHCLDVVDSIDKRFGKGHSHADEFFVRSLLEGLKRRED